MSSLHERLKAALAKVTWDGVLVEHRDDVVQALAEATRDPNRPPVVCLCGSTRFPEEWRDATRRLSLAGEIVLSVGVMIHAGAEPIRDDGPEKTKLDELHLRKIDLADYVLVLNKNGYVGASTAREIAYARSTGKPVRYLEPIP